MIENRRAAVVFLIFVMFTFSFARAESEGNWEKQNAQITSFYNDGQYSEGLKVAELSLDEAKRVLGSDNVNTTLFLNQVGRFYGKLYRYKDAEDAFKQSVETREKLLGAEDPGLIESLNGFGEIYREEGKLGEAELLFKRALAIGEKKKGGEDPSLGYTLDGLGQTLLALRKFTEAELILKRAVDLRKKNGGLELAISLNNIGSLYLEKKEYGPAAAALKTALQIQEKALNSDHPELAPTLNNLGMLALETGNAEAALHDLKRALSIKEETFGSTSPALTPVLNSLGIVNLRLGKLSDAFADFNRAVSILQTSGLSTPDTSTALFNLAAVERKQNNFKGAQLHLHQALAIDERIFGKESQNVKSDYESLAIVYDKLGMHQEAVDAVKRAR